MRMLVVDGYNVIHAWPLLQQILRERGMEDARARLLTALAEYSAQSQVKVTLVFDAHGRNAAAASEEDVDGVTVRYGTRTASADHVIERIANRAARAGNAGDMVVATNDRLQRHLVGGMGVASMSVSSLVDELERVSGDVSDATQRMRDGQHHSQRLEHRLAPDVAERLERLRRGEEPGQ